MNIFSLSFSDDQSAMIGLDNKLVLNRRQPVTNDDPDNVVESSST